MMSAEGSRPRRQLRDYLGLAPQRYVRAALCLLLLLILIVSGEAIVSLDRSRREQAVQALATAQVSALRARLETELNSTLFLNGALVAYVSSVETQLDEARITALLSSLYRTGRNIRNLAVAPGNRVSWVYPLTGNERVLGLYYPNTPSQWPAVQRAMQARSTQVAGPLKLVQGGVGLVARTPVFNADGSYWGLLSMVIDWESLQRNAGIREQAGDFRIAIRGRDGLGRQGEVFFGDPVLFEQQPLTMDMVMPGGTWNIGVVPMQGWQGAAQPPLWARPLYVLVAALVALLFYGMLRDAALRRDRSARLATFNQILEERVAARTQALQASNNALEETLATLQSTQHELVRNEKMAALGSLVAGVAHELNTPLGNSVLAATTLEHRARELSDYEGRLTRSQFRQAVADIVEASSLVHQSVTRAARLVTSFKQVAADRSSEQRRRFELDTLVSNLVLMLQPTLRRAQVRVEHDVPALEMDSYPGLLDQVLMNLVLNAVTHAFPQQQGGLISITGFAEGEQLRLVVADDGVGMAPEILLRVFDPFFTTRLGQGGTGLGLHIVYNIVSGPLGGNITVSSEPGAGAAFTLRLPCKAPQADQPVLQSL